MAVAVDDLRIIRRPDCMIPAAVFLHVLIDLMCRGCEQSLGIAQACRSAEGIVRDYGRECTRPAIAGTGRDATGSCPRTECRTRRG